jgi:hypothetical protein
MLDFPKAIPVPRGCGEREPGGVYIECGLSPYGRPLEDFLIDPPLPPPEGKGKEELANKPQLWVRTARTDPDDPSTEYVVMNPGTEQPIVDLLLWIGAEYYPFVSDYIEEVRRFGASRKLNPNLDFSQLTRWSRMILIHPYALNTLWEQQRHPRTCAKSVPGHALAERDDGEGEEHEHGWQDEGEAPEADVEGATSLDAHTGPCLSKCYELIPAEAAQTPPEPGEVPLFCLRQIGSTIYSYRPTGESADGLRPGIFAALPITGFALIQMSDGAVNERAKAKIEDAQERNGSMALPFYESDQ